MTLVNTRPTTNARGISQHRIGTVRRVQALAFMGWSNTRISAAAGVSERAIERVLAGAPSTIATHAAIASAYSQLWLRQPPRRTRDERYAYERARGRAFRNGWRSPLAWDDIDTDRKSVTSPKGTSFVDEIAVDLACSGEVVNLTPSEREVAVRRLHALGLTDVQIGVRIGCWSETIHRVRKRLGLAANTEQDGEHA